MDTNTEISLMKKDISYIKEDMTKMNEKMDKFIDSAESKFASKLTEKIVFGLVAIILTSVVSALLYLVIK